MCVLKNLQHRNPVMVELQDDILVYTTISAENHAALRAGFVGYPVNPRWNVNKYHAWKTGRHLREGLHEGRLIVRPTDSMLVPLTEQDHHSTAKPSKKDPNPFLLWTKNILTAHPVT